MPRFSRTDKTAAMENGADTIVKADPETGITVTGAIPGMGMKAGRVNLTGTRTAVAEADGRGTAITIANGIKARIIKKQSFKKSKAAELYGVLPLFLCL